MSKRAKKYSELGSIYELCNEKRKLHEQMRVKEWELEQDWEWLKEKYSPRNMLNELMDKIYCSSGIVRKMVTGFDIMKSFFHGGKSHRHGHDYGHCLNHDHVRSHAHDRARSHGHRCGCGCED